MAYLTDLVGVDNVAIGSDFDGATKVPVDTSGLAMLTEELLDRGFTAGEIAAIMGGNALRFLRQTLGA
jgi:membrane dipeptidase